MDTICVNMNVSTTRAGTSIYIFRRLLALPAGIIGGVTGMGPIGPRGAKHNSLNRQPALAPHFGRKASKCHDLPKCGASRRAGRRPDGPHARQDPQTRKTAVTTIPDKTNQSLLSTRGLSLIKGSYFSHQLHFFSQKFFGIPPIPRGNGLVSR